MFDVNLINGAVYTANQIAVVSSLTNAGGGNYTISAAQFTGSLSDSSGPDPTANIAQAKIGLPAGIDPAVAAANGLITYTFNYQDGTPVPAFTGKVVAYNGDSVIVQQYTIFGATSATTFFGTLDPAHFEVFSVEDLSQTDGGPGPTLPWNFGQTGSFATPCFVAGTRIRTPDGEREVEHLAAGDMVETANGAMTVVWVGRRSLDLPRHPDPDLLRAVRIRQDAVAPGVPARDLLVSPDHAVLVDDRLVPARLLLNGASILADGADLLTYVHVELAEHAVLFAENLPSESYLDTGHRSFFEGEAVTTLHPGRREESGMLFSVRADLVRPIWERLAARAVALGHTLPTVATAEPAPRLHAGSKDIAPVLTGDRRAVFMLPAGTGTVRLRSDAGRPADVTPWSDDRRKLGLPVTRIVLRDGASVEAISLDDPRVAGGWWPTERDGAAMVRWTAGDAVLRLATAATVRMLEIELAAPVAHRVARAA